MMATNGNKCVQAAGIGEVYIARNKSVDGKNDKKDDKKSHLKRVLRAWELQIYDFKFSKVMQQHT